MSFFYKAKEKIRLVITANWSDEKYLKNRFKKRLGYELNLDYPKTFCEKLQWLKLNDRKDIYTSMVDKVKVKDIATSKGLTVIPLLGAWNKFDDIDFDKLPNQFVLKTNHTSGGFIICKDKATFDYKKAKKILSKSLKKNYFLLGREWPYKNVERRILAEPFIDSLGKNNSVEYKVTCFNGKIEFVTICTGIAHSDFCLRKNDFYDRDFNFLPFVTEYYENSGIKYTKPSFWDEMLKQAEEMSKGTYYLRVDFYDIDNKPVFGEATFFTWAGFIRFKPEEYDLILGNRLILPIDSKPNEK